MASCMVAAVVVDVAVVDRRCCTPLQLASDIDAAPLHDRAAHTLSDFHIGAMGETSRKCLSAV